MAVAEQLRDVVVCGGGVCVVRESDPSLAEGCGCRMQTSVPSARRGVSEAGRRVVELFCVPRYCIVYFLHLLGERA